MNAEPTSISIPPLDELRTHLYFYPVDADELPVVGAYGDGQKCRRHHSAYRRKRQCDRGTGHRFRSVSDVWQERIIQRNFQVFFFFLEHQNFWGFLSHALAPRHTGKQVLKCNILVPKVQTSLAVTLCGGR